MEVNIYQFWAKTDPYKSLVHHMIDVGNMAQALMQDSSLSSVSCEFQHLLKRDAIQTISCFAALHDIGKLHPCFQNMAKTEYIDSLIEQGILHKHMEAESLYRHEEGSSNALERLLSGKYESVDTLNMLKTVLGLHHQKKHGPQQDMFNKNPGTDFKNYQKELFDLMLSLFDADFKIFNQCDSLDALAVLLWGITVLSDWLASGQEEFFKIDTRLNLGEYFKESAKAASQTVIRCGLDKTGVLPALPFCGIWPTIKPDMRRPVQKICEDIALGWQNEGRAPGMVLIEAPMGEGKTEAALFLAAHLAKHHGKSGMYVALPTAATSNQMYNRFSKLLNSHNIDGSRLLHSMAWLLDTHTPEQRANSEDADTIMDWLAPLRRGLLAQYAVGTVDQVMMAVLKIKYGVLRLLGIQSKVIVIDEVHAYDSYMYAIIERLLKWCSELHIPVILLSATLPRERRQNLIAAYSGITEEIKLSEQYPLITAVSSGQMGEQYSVPDTFMKSEVAIECLPLLNKWEDVSKLALGKLENGGCICILVNTVRDAQELYKTLSMQNSNPSIGLFLFHARYPAGRRLDIEQNCLQSFGQDNLLAQSNKCRPNKAILVATQVVEQSLDLDFDYMISAVAPIDLLLQRMGRLHRHIRTRPDSFKKPQLTVLISEGEIDNTATAAVYAPWILKKTMEVLKDINLIHLPQDIRPLVDSIYGKKPLENDADYKNWTEMIMKEDISSEWAKAAVFPEPQKEYFFAAENTNIFFDEGDDNTLYKEAKTRIGLEQKTIAFIPTSWVEKLACSSKDFAKQILARSVSIRAEAIKNARKHPDFAQAIEGTGYLRGVLLLPTDNGQYKFINAKGNKDITITDDFNLGIIL